MGGVIRFERPSASAAVIASLVALGYLQQAKRHRDTAIKGAIERLRCDLFRAGKIQAGDLSIVEARPDISSESVAACAAGGPTLKVIANPSASVATS